MGSQSETDGIAGNLDPQVTARVARPPFEQEHVAILLKFAASSQFVFIDFLEHLRQAALAKDVFGVLALCDAARGLFLGIERDMAACSLIIVYTIVLWVRNETAFL
jgi:hypothetical protein